MLFTSNLPLPFDLISLNDEQEWKMQPCFRDFPLCRLHFHRETKQGRSFALGLESVCSALKLELPSSITEEGVVIERILSLFGLVKSSVLTHR